MPAVTPIGSSPPGFSIPADECGLSTQSLKLTRSAEMKELKGNFGHVINVAFYNFTGEIETEVAGAYSATDVGAALALAASNDSVFASNLLVGMPYITEVTVTLSNEDYYRTTLKRKAWAAITS